MRKYKAILIYLLMSGTLLRPEVQLVQEQYVVKKGDTLSELLHQRGVKGRKNLYDQNGYVEKNKYLNPLIKDWKALVPGTIIALEYPSSAELQEAPVVNSQVTETAAPIQRVDNSNFLNAGASLSFQYANISEISNSDTTLTKGQKALTRLDAELYYRRALSRYVAAWQYFIAGSVYKAFGIQSLNFPLNGALSLGFRRYNLVQYKNTFVHLGLGMKFEKFSYASPNSSIASALMTTETLPLVVASQNILWAGIMPAAEIVLYGHLINIQPFLYKSVSLSALPGWSYGLLANAGIAYQNKLGLILEFEQRSLSSSQSSIKTNSIMTGIGWKF